MSDRKPNWILITIMAAFIALLIVVLVVRETQAGEIRQIVGFARVIDGDTIEISDHRIRLFGIDAPEMHNPAGPASRAALMQLASSARLLCNVRGIDRYNRLVAVCDLNGSDIGATMVALGWALNADGYTQDYVEYEAWARQNCYGIWSGALCKVF